MKIQWARRSVDLTEWDRRWGDTFSNKVLHKLSNDKNKTDKANKVRDLNKKLDK